MTIERSDVLVLFGATGDLAHKKIFPALYAMVERGTLNEPVVGVALDAWDLPKLVARARDGIEHAGVKLDEAVFAKLAGLLHYVNGDYRDQATFDTLKQTLGPARHPLHYLAVPPSMFEPVVQGLEQSGCAVGARLMVEKPFGRDLQSARWLNRVLHMVFDEDADLPHRPLSRQGGDPEPRSISASPTPSSSRSGTATSSTACRSPWPRISASKGAAASTTRWAASAT